jgi:phosphohistidine phosphatase
MTQRIVLVRHAKSSWDDPALPDHDRPLAPRGERALPGMREHIARLELPALVVLCSTARRAVDTLDGIRAGLPTDASVRFDRALYHADAEALLEILQSLGRAVSSAMVIGHNPTLQDLACSLVGSGDHDDRRQLATKLPTGSIVTMSMAVSMPGAWTLVRPGTARLDDLYLPRRR